MSTRYLAVDGTKYVQNIETELNTT